MKSCPCFIMGRWKCRPLSVLPVRMGSTLGWAAEDLQQSQNWILEAGSWVHICLQKGDQGDVDVPQWGFLLSALENSIHVMEWSWACQASHGSSAALVELGAGLWLLPRLADLKLTCVSVHYTEACKHILGPAISRGCNGGNSRVKIMSSAPHSTVCKYCFGFLLIP